MAIISMKQLLEAGVHFGHQTRRWNPKMARYIFTERNGIYIIDLQKTVGKVKEAYNFIQEVVREGKSILFVGTKKQAQEAVCEDAKRCGMYYVNQRWLGGMMTNFKTIEKRINRLKQIERESVDGTFEILPKKEVKVKQDEMKKLEKYLGGIKDMHDYPIPGNDDAIRAVKLLCGKMADAVLEARAEFETAEAEANEGEEVVVEEVSAPVATAEAEDEEIVIIDDEEDDEE